MLNASPSFITLQYICNIYKKNVETIIVPRKILYWDVKSCICSEFEAAGKAHDIFGVILLLELLQLRQRAAVDFLGRVQVDSIVRIQVDIGSVQRRIGGAQRCANCAQTVIGLLRNLGSKFVVFGVIVDNPEGIREGSEGACGWPGRRCVKALDIGAVRLQGARETLNDGRDEDDRSAFKRFRNVLACQYSQYKEHQVVDVIIPQLPGCMP